MTLWWSTCPYCGSTTPDRHTETEALNDRDDHVAVCPNADRESVPVHHYAFLEVHA